MILDTCQSWHYQQQQYYDVENVMQCNLWHLITMCQIISTQKTCTEISYQNQTLDGTILPLCRSEAESCHADRLTQSDCLSRTFLITFAVYSPLVHKSHFMLPLIIHESVLHRPTLSVSSAFFCQSFSPTHINICLEFKETNQIYFFNYLQGGFGCVPGIVPLMSSLTFPEMWLRRVQMCRITQVNAGGCKLLGSPASLWPTSSSDGK